MAIKGAKNTFGAFSSDMRNFWAALPYKIASFWLLSLKILVQ
jgi:hypothetical protein